MIVASAAWEVIHVMASDGSVFPVPRPVNEARAGGCIAMFKIIMIQMGCLIGLFFPGLASAQEVPHDAIAAAESFLHDHLISGNRLFIKIAAQQGIAQSEFKDAILGQPYYMYKGDYDDILDYQSEETYFATLQLTGYRFPILINGRLCGAVKISYGQCYPGWTSEISINKFIVEKQRNYSINDGCQFILLNLANSYSFVMLKRGDSLSIAPSGEREAFVLSGLTGYAAESFMSLGSAIPLLKEAAIAHMRAARRPLRDI